MDAALYLLAAALVVGGVAGAILPVLPGIPMIFGGIWLAAAVDAQVFHDDRRLGHGVLLPPRTTHGERRCGRRQEGKERADAPRGEEAHLPAGVTLAESPQLRRSNDRTNRQLQVFPFTAKAAGRGLLPV